MYAHAADDRFVNDDWAVPDAARKFVQSLHKVVKEQNVYEMQNLYNNQFFQVTERYFKASAWPSADLIESLVDHDATFLLLYKELYYRHIYTNRDLVPTVQDRVAAFENYVALFNLMLEQPHYAPELDLPNQWNWDILEQFVSDYQEFQVFRRQTDEHTDDETAILAESENVWSAAAVLRYLHALVAKGRVPLHFNAELVEAPEEASKIARMTAYFSLIALSNVHMLLGDFHTALQVLGPVDIRRGSQLVRVTSCFVSAYFVMGFSYLMLHRFVDAIRTFSTLLSHASRQSRRAGGVRHLAVDSYAAIVERAQALLAVAYSLCSARVDESVLAAVKEEHGDEMDNGSLDAFRRLFVLGCPSFACSCRGDADDRDDSDDDNDGEGNASVFVDIFMKEISQRKRMVSMGMFLKLYTTISLPKLALALQLSEETLVNQLLSLKHRTRNLRWKGEAPLDGVWESSSNLDFFVANDVVHVTYSKPPRSHRDYFFRNVHKLNELLDDIERIN